MGENDRRHIRLPPPPSDERQPLLGEQLISNEAGEPVFSCHTNPHSHLPVYTNIHRIRRDIISVVEDYLSLPQLTDVRLNVTVVRPLVDKFYELEDISIIYCLLVNRAQFLEEESRSSHRQNVNWTRATLCELIATRILRRFGEDHQGPDGLLLLAHILVAGFEPFQNAPARIRAEAEATTAWTHQRTLPSLEIAILTESKHFLNSSTCQRIVAAVYEGKIVYTPSTNWDIIPDHYKLKPISLYEPRESPLLNQYRLTVPRTRTMLEMVQFCILLGLYISVMVVRKKDRFTGVELAFVIYSIGWAIDQFATIIAHGWSIFTQNLWSFLDITFVAIFAVFTMLRFHAFRTNQPDISEQAFDVLALAAPVLVPRLAFSSLSDNLVFLSLRSMMSDFFLLTALAAWCFVGFMLSLLWLGDSAHSIVTISKWMIYIWFGLDGTGIQRSAEFHSYLGPTLMVMFAFLGNTLFLTILVSMLSNTFSNISTNATAEIQFRRAVLTLEGVKADAIFAYQPPFNILAVVFLLPLKFLVTARWFHKIHVASVRIINLPLLLLIAVFERRLLWPGERMQVGDTFRPAGRKPFWKKWHLTAERGLRAVFEVPAPDDVQEDIAVDDAMTHHLIRKQFTRSQTAETLKRIVQPRRQTSESIKKPSRRDSMFPGVRPTARGSFTATEDTVTLAADMETMKKSMLRLEGMLAKLVPATEGDDDDDEAVGSEESTSDLGDGSTLKDGLTAESSFRGTQ